MKIHVLVPAAAFALLLAGCEPSTAPGNSAATAPASTPSPAASDYYAARIDALPAKQRGAVLFRAIKDAGGDCAAMTGAETHAPVEGRPAWTVHCAAGKGERALDWVVILQPGGMMRIVRPGAL